MATAYSTLSFSRPIIGHFRVPKTLTLKMRPSAQPFLWKRVLFFAWDPYCNSLNFSFGPRHILLYFKHPFQIKDLGKIDELVQERDHTKQYYSSCEKKKEERNKVTLIASPFILSHRPSLPKKAIVRYRFGVQLWTVAVLFSGTVCPAPRPRIIHYRIFVLEILLRK